MLKRESVVLTPVNIQNNHHDLTLLVTKADLADIGISSEADVTVTCHCCICPAEEKHFSMIDPITIGDKVIGEDDEGRWHDYGHAPEFPFERAKLDFVTKVTAMLLQAVADS